MEWENGFSAGYSKGHSDGYDVGFDNGFKEGEEAGFDEASLFDQVEAREEGFREGRELINAPSRELIEIGRKQGYEEGAAQATISTLLICTVVIPLVTLGFQKLYKEIVG